MSLELKKIKADNLVTQKALQEAQGNCVRFVFFIDLWRWTDP